MALKRTFSRVAHRLESGFDARRAEIRDPSIEEGRIVPYRTFGTAAHLHVRGRVLRGTPGPSATEADSKLRNVVAAWSRLRSDEVGGAVVEALWRDQAFRITTDDEGYFHAQLDVAAEGEGWLNVPLRLVSPQVRRGSAGATAEVLVPPAGTTLGVISDLDDTVVQTGATALGTMLRAVFFHNSRTRLPFEGVAELYRQFADGGSPIFYVSSGPWNFYDVYSDFLDFREIPRGPILLGDFGLDEEMFIHAPHLDHKLRSIRAIFDEYREMRFVLIGDSGQHDPEVYRDVVAAYPGRVAAVYIRDVSATDRDKVVMEIGATLTTQGVDLLFAADTAAMARHAAGLLGSS